MPGKRIGNKFFAVLLVFALFVVAGSAYADPEKLSGGRQSSLYRRTFSEKSKIDAVIITLLIGGVFWGCKGCVRMMRRRRISKYMKADPVFNKDDIESFAKDLFFKLQNAWNKKDITPLKDKMTGEFFKLMDGRLDRLRQKGRTDHTEQIHIFSSSLYDIKQKNGTVYAEFKLDASVVSYITHDATLKTVSGNSKKKVKMIYYMKFAKTADKAISGTTQTVWLVCGMSGHKKRKKNKLF